MTTWITTSLLGVALSLAACSPSNRAVPRYDDPEGAAQAMLTLSPWNDGSPDRSNDGRTPGDWDSDRQTFARWFARYMRHEVGLQHQRDYQPFPVPSTIAQAIEQQRTFERDRRQKEDAAAAERAEEQVELDADAEHHRMVEQQEQEAETAAITAAAAKQADQDAALNAEQQAAKEAQQAAQLAEAKQTRANYECRLKRQEAASATLSNRSGTAEPGAYQRVWDNFQCRND
jgi:hypothetical protein